jgi:hypothetical protein
VPLPDATVASSDSAAARDCQWLRDLRLTREMLSPDKVPYVPAPRPATHHENRFPLTRLPVDDGAHYPQALFEDQLALTNVDHFVYSRGVCFPPSRFAWQPVFDQVHVNVRRLVADLPSCGALHGKKIGITACPSKRFHRKENWSYWREGWDMMTVVFAGPPCWAAELERSLIAEWKGTNGCQNSLPGGENRPKKTQPGFVYVVTVDLSLGLALQQKAKSRTDAEKAKHRRMCELIRESEGGAFD